MALLGTILNMESILTNQESILTTTSKYEH